MLMDMSFQVTVAAAYVVIAAQLVGFARSPTFASIFDDKTLRNDLLYKTAMWVCVLYASFIGLCGTTHLVDALRYFYPTNPALKVIDAVSMALCAVVSVVTAIASMVLFPRIADALEGVSLNSQGKFHFAEKYMVEVVNLLKESVVVLTPSGIISRGNLTTSEIFGPDFVGLHVTPLVYAEDRRVFEDTLQRVMQSVDGAPHSVEYRVKSTARKDSSTSSRDPKLSQYMWVESTLCKGTSLSRAGEFEYDIKMTTRNIEDRKKSAHYRAYYENAKETEVVNEAKLRYISCITHDLKTPLQSFCFTVDLLKHSDLTNEQMELVDQVNVSIDLMKLTISQTLDISKALTGAKLMPRRTAVQLSSVLDRVNIIINGYGKQVPVIFSVAPEICDTILTDEEWLWQILLNLLTNACKYTERGSITVKVSLTSASPASPTNYSNFSAPPKSEKTRTFRGMRSSFLTASSVATVTDICTVPHRHNLLFEVIDTGIGIREDKLESVFEAFSQVQSGQVTGTGLGLFGVRRRVEGLHGTCGARRNTESPTGTGTVIWFSIPYLIDHTEAILGQQLGGSGVDTQSPSHQRIKPTTSGLAISPSQLIPLIREREMTAIIVDDTSTIRKLMERSLTQLGFVRVVGCSNGSQGLDAMIAEQVDIVFSDVQMPIMTGPEMTRRFREFEAAAIRSGQRSKRQMIVVVSANRPDEADDENDGFDFVCAKPLSRVDLMRLVHEYISMNPAQSMQTGKTKQDQ